MLFLAHLSVSGHYAGQNAVCAFVCLDVNCTNHNCCTQRLV